MAGLTPRSSAEKTREALAAVLEDQVERKLRREEASPGPKDRSRFAQMAVFPLAVLTLWFVAVPPAFVRPAPAPAPTFEDMRNGLRMDIYAVAAQVIGYRNANGRLPRSLVGAVAEPAAAEGLTYSPGPGSNFEIAGERAGQVVVYRSTEPLSEFVARARTRVKEGS